MSSFDDNDGFKRLRAVEYKALDMDVPPPTTRQLGSFLLRYKSMPISFIIGLIICLGVIAYTRYISTKNLTCPTWAVDCSISPFVGWNAANIAVVQGVITICYGVGLAAMAYAAEGLAESMIWPLLSDKHMSIEQMETYLSTAHGAIPIRKATIQLFSRTTESALIMTLTILTALTPLSAGPLVGTVYARSNFAHVFHIKYKVGAGIGRIFAQTTPPIAVGAESMSSFLSWSKGLSQEPLPEARHWVVDRSLLLDVGNITVNAVYTKVDIMCRGFNATPIEPVKDKFVTYSTKMATHNFDDRAWNSSSTVIVRAVKSLAVWVNDYTFNHRNRSTAVLVFSANNGTIEGGTTNHIATHNSNNYPTSTLACTIGIEFIDSILQLGTGGPTSSPYFINLTTLSSVAGTHISFKNSSTNPSLNTLNENALWFATAPVLMSPSIGGAQPEYYKDLTSNATADNIWLGLPVPFTKGPYMSSEALSSNDGTTDVHITNDWSLDDIHNFINVSIGSVAQASSRNFQAKEPVLLASVTQTRKLDSSRVKYLVVPMILVVVWEVGLLVVMIRLYARSGVPAMRTAGIGEVVWACRNEAGLWRGGGARYDGVGEMEGERVGGGGHHWFEDTGFAGMERAKVMFEWTKGAGGSWVAGLSREVRKFKE